MPNVEPGEFVDVTCDAFNCQLHVPFLSLWFIYLSKCELAVTPGEHKSWVPKLHRASRFRDVQILGNKVDQLPKYINGKNPPGFYKHIRSGDERVLRDKPIPEEVSGDSSDE